MDAQLKKGILEMCILHAVEQRGDAYGYDVIRSLHDSFPDVAESAFYAILRRLDREGAATTFAGSASRGPVRKYYRITEQGRQRLEEMKADWKYLQQVTAEMGI